MSISGRPEISFGSNADFCADGRIRGCVSTSDYFLFKKTTHDLFAFAIKMTLVLDKTCQVLKTWQV